MSPEQDELDVLLEKITEKEKAAEKNREDVNRKKENDKINAEEMRKKKTMKRMGQAKKRKSQEDNEGRKSR